MAVELIMCCRREVLEVPFQACRFLTSPEESTLLKATKEGLLKVKDSIQVLTEAEKLPNHYKAVEARFEK